MEHEQEVSTTSMRFTSRLDGVIEPLDGLLAAALRKWAERVCIDKPIVIFGMERSGTTLLYSLLANHPDPYWLSRLDSVLPSAPCISSMARRVISVLFKSTYVAIPGAISTSRGAIAPSECLPYWRKIFRWGTEDDYLIQDDRFTEEYLTSQEMVRIRRDLRMRLFIMGKKRLLFKQPGFSLKIRYLNALFPDARFIHVLRNPIDNFASLMRAKRAAGGRFWGIKVPGWRTFEGDLAEQTLFQLRSVLDIIDEDMRAIPDWRQRFMRIHYEDLVEDPHGTIQAVSRFVSLDGAASIARAYAHVVPQPVDREWLDALPANTRDELKQLASKYGYKNLADI
jgi:LPS sulfotransferase NodH